MKTIKPVRRDIGKPLLAIDIGNSTMGLGLFLSAAGYRDLRVARIKLPSHLTALALRKDINNFLSTDASDALQVVIASVVPKATGAVVSALRPWCKTPIILDCSMTPSLLRSMPCPEKIGSDRIANAAAAWHLCRKPAAIADFGTATTITVVGAGPRLLGGAILPGLKLMSGALAHGTAKLPPIPLEAPVSALGKETVAAIQSGILLGSAGAVTSLVRHMEEDIGMELQLFVTGGHAETLSSLIERQHILDPALTLIGLRVLFAKITGRQT